MSFIKIVGKIVDWGFCVGSLKVDLWSVVRNEDNIFFGIGDVLGISFNFLDYECI